MKIVRGLINSSNSFAHLSPYIFAIQHCDHARRDICRADSLAGVVVGAVAKPFLLHGADHVAGAALSLGLPLWKQAEVGDLGTDEEHRGAIRAGSGTSATTDTCCGIHGSIGHRFRNECRRSIGRPSSMLADEPSRPDDSVVGTAIHHQILHDREGIDAVGFDGDGLAILKLPHVDLTGSSTTRSLRDTIDDHAAGSTNPLATVAFEGDGLFPLNGEAVVHDIKHLKEGALGGDLLGINLDKISLALF